MKRFAQAAVLVVLLFITSTQVLANQNNADTDLIPATGELTEVDTEYEYEPEIRPERPTPPAPLRNNATQYERDQHERAMAAFYVLEDAFYASLTNVEILTRLPDSERSVELLRDLLASKRPEMPIIPFNPNVSDLNNILRFINQLSMMDREAGEFIRQFNIAHRHQYNEIFRKLQDKAIAISVNCHAYLNDWESPEFVNATYTILTELYQGNEFINMFNVVMSELQMHRLIIQNMRFNAIQIRNTLRKGSLEPLQIDIQDILDAQNNLTDEDSELLDSIINK